jgi:hypothetical protein
MGLAKVAVKYSADTFVVNQSLVLRIIIRGENPHLHKTLTVNGNFCGHSTTFKDKQKT